MAPLPANNTPRYKVFYTNCGVQHTQEWRSPNSPAAMSVDLDVLWTAASPLLKATVIDEVQFCASGQNVFNSVAMDFVGETYGSGAGTVSYVPLYVDFVGRSTGGRRVRAAFFGAALDGADYRFVAGENADVDNVVGVLQSGDFGVTAIDGLTPIWKSYANAGYNAYWQRAVRP